MKKRENIILDLSGDFSLQIIDFCRQLKKQHHYGIASQLMRSGTSIGANIWESQSCESRKDFGHKLKVADKEAGETEYWLLLCKLSEQIQQQDDQIDRNLLSIKRLLSKIISTNKKRA